MKPGRQSMVWTGWGMTLIGVGVVLFWTIYEAIGSFSSEPLATLIGVLVVLLLLALLVPVPLIIATRRARTMRSSSAR